MKPLEQQTKKFQELLKNLPTGALVYELSRGKLYVNNSFHSLFPDLFSSATDLSRKQLIERLSSTFKDPSYFAKKTAEFFTNRSDITGWAQQTAANYILSIDFRFFDIPQPFVFGTFKDVTEIKQSIDQIKLQEDKYRVVLENMNLGILEVDTENVIKEVYSKFCDMTGYQREELLGLNARDLLLSEEDQSELEAQDAKRLQGISSSYEIRLKRKDGHSIWVMVSSTPIYDSRGQVTGSFGIHMDITHLKETEQALLEESQKTLEAIKWKEDLMTKMSHEMRTPLSGIMGMVNLLLEESQLPSKQKHTLQTIKKSANNLMFLIEDLLDYAVMEQGEMNLEEQPFVLYEVMDSVQHHFAELAAEKENQILLEFDEAIPDKLYGDPAKIGQALKHLLSNAIKFSNKTTVQFEAHKTAENDAEVEVLITIVDHGIGIPAKELKNILRGFYQIEQTQTINTGIGIGLSMVKLIADKMNGELEVSSEEGKGTTAKLYLTLQKPVAATSIGDMVGKRPEEINILVAEDNVINQMLLKENLKRWKFNFDLVENGQKALQMLKADSYDLALMDVQMPVLGGIETTKYIRKKMPEGKRQIPILALTAYGFAEDRNKCMKAGMDDYISKPFTPAQLYYKISRLIPISSAHKPGTTGDANNKKEIEVNPDILDSKKITQFTRGNMEIQQRLIKRFLTDVPGDLQHLLQLKEDREWTELFELIHRLKPTISMMGIKKGEAIAAQLHNEMKDGSPPENPDTINEFVYAVEEALPELKKIPGN